MGALGAEHAGLQRGRKKCPSFPSNKWSFRGEAGEKPSLQLWFSFGFSFSTSLWPVAYKKRVKLPRRISYLQQFQIPLAIRKTRTTPLPLPKRKWGTYTSTGMKISWLFILSCWIGKHNYYNSLDTAQLLAPLPCSPPHSPPPQFLFGTCSNQTKYICNEFCADGKGCT